MSKILFPPWKESEWTAQNDTLRGGSSSSYFNVTNHEETAIFGGFVDIKTLGGAGFASQRTTGKRNWDLSKYDGLEIVVKTGCEGSEGQKKITLVLKDRVFEEQESDGKERSTVSFEYTFLPPAEKTFIPWRELKPFYRGRELKPDDDLYTELRTDEVKRISWMCRSLFGEQEGAFMAKVKSITAVRRVDEEDDALDHENEAPVAATSLEGSRWAAKAKKLAENGGRCGVDDLDEEMEDAGKTEKEKEMLRVETKPRNQSGRCCAIM